MKVDVTLNGAEADALQQILDRHVGVMDTFERNLLASVARKVTHARSQLHQDESWRRFVWTAEDVTILKAPQPAKMARCACECHPSMSRPTVTSGGRWCTECVGDRAWLAEFPFPPTDEDDPSGL